MLTLNDGRSELWQWDTGRKLTVDADCTQVHFSNKVFGRSIDVDVMDGVAIIPDILLQTEKDLTAWAFVGTAENGYTKISKVFKVNKRNKPSDYVFTPTDQATLGEILNRIEDLEKRPSGVEGAVLYTEQELTEEQKAQARENIGVSSGGNVELDTTLTQSGKAADARAVGDAVKALSDEVVGVKNSIDSFFVDAGTSNNILPPDSEPGYFDLETGEPRTSSNHVRTPVPIQLESGKTNLYIISNITSTTDNVNAALMWLDASGNLLSYKNISRTAMQGKSSVGAIPSNATQVHVWLKGSSLGYSLANMCISYDELPVYEAYVAPGARVIKAESLDPVALKTFAPLYKKKIVNFGDSIYGKRRPPEDISTELASVTGAIVYNCGFGGCRMAQHSIEQYDAFSMYRLAHSIANNDWTLQDSAIAQETWEGGKPPYFAEVLTMLKGIDFNEVDIVTIAYGTNDFTGNIVLENAENAQDTASFAGALRYSIETLLTAYPHLKIFVCSQVWRFWMDSDNVYTEDSDVHINGRGVKLTEFVEKTEEVSREYHLPYIDTYYSTGFNKFNRGMYFSTTDGTHPLTTGLHVIAHVVAQGLH